MPSKSLIQFSVDGQGCVPSLFFGLRPNYGRGNDTTVSHSTHTSARDPCTIHRQVWLSLLWGHCSFPLAHGAHKVLFVPSKSLFSQSCIISVIKSHWPPKSNSLGVLIPFAGYPGWETFCGSKERRCQRMFKLPHNCTHLTC